MVYSSSGQGLRFFKAEDVGSNPTYTTNVPFDKWFKSFPFQGKVMGSNPIWNTDKGRYASG